MLGVTPFKKGLRSPGSNVSVHASAAPVSIKKSSCLFPPLVPPAHSLRKGTGEGGTKPTTKLQ